MVRTNPRSNYYYSKSAGMWHSTITRKNKTVSIGYFDTEAEARRMFLWCRWLIEHLSTR